MIRALRRPIIWLPISVGLLVFIAWRSEIWKAGGLLGRIDPWPVLVAVVLNGPIALLWALRSADLLAAAERPVPARALVPMTAFANLINGLTPGSAGELSRLYLLRVRHGVDVATGGAAILIERVVAVGYLVGSAAIFWLALVVGLPGWVVVGLLFVLAASPLVAYRVGVRPSRLLAWLPFGRVGGSRAALLEAVLRDIDATITTLLSHPVRVAIFAVSTGGVLACYAAQLWLVGQALGVEFTPWEGWAALGLSVVAGVVSLLPFGLGATDLAVVALLASFGVGVTEATAVAFGYRLVATLPLGIMGAVSYAFLAATLPSDGPARLLGEIPGQPADPE